MEQKNLSSRNPGEKQSTLKESHSRNPISSLTEEAEIENLSRAKKKLHKDTGNALKPISPQKLGSQMFYIFDVGQGNSQLACMGNWGILYDCGTYSSKLHPKIQYLRTQSKGNGQKADGWFPLFSRIHAHVPNAFVKYNQDLYEQLDSENAQSKLDPEDSNKNIIQSQEQKIQKKQISQDISQFPESQHQSDQSENDDSMQMGSSSNENDESENDDQMSMRSSQNQIDESVNDLATLKSQTLSFFLDQNEDHGIEKENKLALIRQVINLSKFEHLFIILSHPDSDHINFLSQKIIPDNLEITVFLEGHWFGKTNSSSSELFGEDVAKILQFLSKRPNTKVEFPTYWRGIYNRNKKYIPYEEIINVFQNEGVRLLQSYYTGSYPYSGQLMVFQKKLSTEFIPYETLKEYCQRKDPQKLLIFKGLQNVKIAHGRAQFDDFNQQSAIVQITLPELGMHVFLTGDATDATLKKAKKAPFWSNFQKKENFSSLVILPHHGSQYNHSPQIWNIFKPDIIGISAGNGKKDDQPSTSLIRQIRKDFWEKDQEGWIDKKDITISKNFFFKQFNPNYPNMMASFESIKKKNEKKITKVLMHCNWAPGRSKDVFKDIVPFICTNILGTIRVDSQGFSSRFSGCLFVQNLENQEENIHKSMNIFFADYKKRVDVGDIKPTPWQGMGHGLFLYYTNPNQEGAPGIKSQILHKLGNHYYKVHPVENIGGTQEHIELSKRRDREWEERNLWGKALFKEINPDDQENEQIN